jgi:S-formylglutathione hydrolase FrmB
MYRIIVPTHQPSERLPVLYFLHGFGGSPGHIMQESQIVQLAERERLIVVLPDGRFSYFTNAKHLRKARWEDAMTQELTADVQANFPALSGREHTGVAGISMGGYGAAKLALKHPELYGFAGVMSGALDITRRRATVRRLGQSWRIWMIFGFRPETRRDEDVFDLLAASHDAGQTRWFVSWGAADPLAGTGSHFDRQLQQSGVEPVRVVSPGGHDWQSWNAALPELLSTAGKALR